MVLDKVDIYHYHFASNLSWVTHANISRHCVLITDISKQMTKDCVNMCGGKGTTCCIFYSMGIPIPSWSKRVDAPKHAQPQRGWDWVSPVSHLSSKDLQHIPFISEYWLWYHWHKFLWKESGCLAWRQLVFGSVYHEHGQSCKLPTLLLESLSKIPDSWGPPYCCPLSYIF